MAAGLPQFFQAPVVIRPWRQKPYDQHDGDHPPDQFCAAGQEVVGEVHGYFHREHGDEAHAHGGGQGVYERHAFAHQYDHFEYDAGDQAVDDGQAEDQQDRGVRGIDLKVGNGAEVAYGTADETPHGIVGTFPPGSGAAPKGHRSGD